MGLDFLRHYGGRRLRQYVEQPPLDSSAADDEEDEEAESRRSTSSCRPMPGSRVRSRRTPSIRPRCRSVSSMAAITERRSPGLQDSLAPSHSRFAWPRSAACACSIDGRSLRREFAQVERIVCLIVDPFPWHEVEDFRRGAGRQDRYASVAGVARR